MKIVQTTISETEHRLLEEYARRNSKTIKEVLMEAIRKTILDDRVELNDPLFTEPPSSKKTGRKDDGSEKHDSYLYGAKHS
jgi:hypothetical protein